MTNITDTFGIFTDSSCTVPFTGTLEITHETDQSDNPQVFGPYYIGSATSGRTLEATSNPGVDNITITPTDGLADWAATTAYSLGDRVEPTTPNGLLYECTTAGTSGGSEPTFPTGAIGDTVVDGTVVWTYVAARHEITEVELSDDNVTYQTAGNALSLGTSISGSSGNAKTLYIRVTNAVTSVISNTSYPEITLDINEVQETA